MRDFAFPQVWPGNLAGQMQIVPGMSRRDVYAGQLAAALLLAAYLRVPTSGPGISLDDIPEAAAEMAAKLDELVAAASREEMTAETLADQRKDA